MADGLKKNKKSRAKKLNSEKTKKAKDLSVKKNTSLRLEPTVLKQLKIRAIEDDTSVQQVLEMLVTDYLKKPT